MAANDLMMKIQVLVDSGKSTAELDRLNKKLADLTDELKNLEKAKITPLNDDLAEIKRTSQALKNINLGNYVKNLEKVGEAFQRLNVDTKNIDRLRDAFKNLEAENATKSVANLETQLRNAKLQLEGISASARNGILFVDPRNTFDLNQAQKSIKDIGADITMNNGLIRDERNEIIRLKNELRNVGTVYQKELLGAGRLDLSGLSRQLKEQKADLTLGQQAVKDYTTDLRSMKKELSNLRKVGKEISGAKLADAARMIFTTDIAKFTKSLEQANLLLKNYKQNLKAIQDSNMRFRISSAESLFGERTVRSIATVKSEILSLKDAIKSASAVKFDAGITASISSIDAGLKSIKEEKAFESLRDFNAELTKQQQELQKTNRSIKLYNDQLTRLKIEAQKKAIPDFTLGGTADLLGDLNRVEQKLRNIRTNELIPTQNELRNIQSARTLDKAKFIDDLKAVNKLYQAEINIEKLKSKEERNQAAIDSRVQTIANNELEIARRNLDIVRSYGIREASLKKQQNDIKNSIDLLSNEEKTIKSLIAGERQRAKEAAQSVKTRTGGTIDITNEKANQQTLANLYRSNVDSLKNYFSTLKRGAQESAAALMPQLSALNEELKLAKQLEAKQKSAIASQQTTITQTEQLINAEKERYENLARLGKLQNQYDQKILQDRIRAREVDLDAAKSGVDSIKQKVTASKEEMASVKEVIRLREQDIRSAIATAQQRIASGQLTSAQLKEERDSIKESVAEQKNLSKAYQEGLKDNARGLEAALKGAEARIAATQQQIKELKLLNTEEARNKALLLEQELGAAQKEKTDIKQQITDTENLTRAEATRITELERSARAMEKQGKQLTTLGRLFNKSGGLVREFGDALTFALGPQAAGFLVAATVATTVRDLAAAFFEANKSVENLLRGLNALSGGQGTMMFDQLVESSNRLGIPLKQVSQSFLEIQAATEGTNFEGQKTKELFDALANALTVTGADAVQFNRGFRALGQILSKDQLYAEELRQQLGEALPGAVQLFARALNISPKQLLQFMEAGVVEGENLRRTLVLVTREMEKTYKVANEQDFTFTQKAALAQNALNLLFVEIGNTGIWRAFGNALLFARDQFVALREAIPSLSDSFKNEFNLIAAIVSGGSEEINNSFQSIEPMFNFETLKKQLAEIASFINDSALGWLRSIVQFTEDAALIIKNFNAKLESQRQPLLTIGIEDEKLFAFLDKINQYTPSVKLKELFAAYLEDIKEISSTPVEIVPEIVHDDFNKFKKDVIEFNRNAEIDFTISDENLVKIYNEYIERINRANEAIREQNALNEQTNRILKQNTIESENAAKSRKTAEQVARENADAMEAFRKAQKDANALQKIYDIDLNYESTLKERSLKISKEQAKLDKEILGIQQTYQDTMLDINASKYQRWAEQGQITRETAQFLTEVDKSQAAYKAWNAAQEAVAAYNAEADKGAEANKDTLDILKQQADDQLRYADSKAKAVGDEYRIKQIMEEQLALRQRQQQLIENFPKILDKAEINSQANPVPEPEKQAVVNDLQSYFDRNKPTISIVPQIDEAGQQQTLEAFRTVKAELDALRQGAIIPVVLNLQDNTRGLFQKAGLTAIPDQNIRITVDDGGTLRQALIDAQGLREAINGLQSGKKFTVEFLDPQGNVERIEEYVRDGKTVRINLVSDPQVAAAEGQKAGTAASQAANAAIQKNPIQGFVLPNALSAENQTRIAGLGQSAQEVFNKSFIFREEVFSGAINTLSSQLSPEFVAAGNAYIRSMNSGIQAEIPKLISDTKNNLSALTKPVESGQIKFNVTANQEAALAEGQKAGNAIAQGANTAIQKNPVTLVLNNETYKRDLEKVKQFTQGEFSKGTFSIGLAKPDDSEIKQLAPDIQKSLESQKYKVIIDEPIVDGEKIRRLTIAQTPDLSIPVKVPDALTSENKARIAGLSQSAQEIFNKSFIFREDVFSGALNLLSSQLDPKFVEAGNAYMRAMNNGIQTGIPALIAETKDKLSGLADQVKSEPIEITANTQPLIGQIQEQLAALQQSGATKIKVTLDENSGKLVVTADVSQAQGDIAALKTQIETSPAVQKVNFTFDPVPTTVDPAEQKVNRIFDEVPTQLAPAYQTVYRNIVTTGGSPSGMARGGLVPGGYSNRDSVSALLAPGEFVIPSSVVRALSPSFFYDLIRSRSLKVPKVSARDNLSVPHFAAGGLVQSSSQPIVINVGSKPIHLSGSREAANQLAKVLIQTGRAL